MGRIDDFVEAVTYRLRPDPELHMDVSREIRAHLEDAVAEARAGGRSEAEAVEEALRSFGDREEMAARMFRANRRRMRLRAVAKWAVRCSLVPAAIAFAAYLFFGSSGVTGIYETVTLDGPIVGPARRIRPRPDLTEEERLIHGRLSGDLSEAKSLVLRFPDRPDFYGHYVRLYLSSYRQGDGEELEEALRILDRGEAIDPDNALYDYLKAGLMMERSSKQIEDAGIRYTSVDHRGQTKAVRADGLEITDRPLFERAAEEFLKGAVKPRCTGYAVEIAELGRELSVAPDSLIGEAALIYREAGTLVSHLMPMRNLARRLPPYAMILAEEGRKEEAIRIAEPMDRPGVQLGAQSDLLIELLVARAVLTAVAGQAPAIYAALDMPGKAEQARLAFQENNRRWAEPWREGDEPAFAREVRKRYGLLLGRMTPAVPGFGDPVIVPALRKTEHVLVQRFALSLLVAVLLALTLGFGVLNAWNLWRHRKRADGPKLFFVGWARIAWIVLPALALPTLVYWAYTRLAPFSSMTYGINYLPGRVAVELALVFAVVLGALMGLGYRAVRGRCADAGMDTPPAHIFNPLRSRILTGVIVLFAGGLVAYFALWQVDLLRGIGGLLVAVVILLAVVLYFLLESGRLRRAAPAHFRRTFVRSLMPILASCLLLVGVASHVYLRWSEAHYVQRLHRPGHRLFLDEIDMTSLKQYRDYLKELNQQWPAEHRPPTAAPH